MTQIRDLPFLAVIPIDKLLLHERHDQQRSPLLLESLRKSGVLRNPPIVAPLHDRTGRYMVLDGAHRVLSVQTLGFPHILAQVVEPDDPRLALTPWNHVLWDWDSEEFIESVRSIPLLDLCDCDDERACQELANRQAIALIRLPYQGTHSVHPPKSDLFTRVSFLNALVDRYKDRSRLDRTNIEDVYALAKLYPTLTALVVLPPFRIEEVLYLASEGYMLPTGSTRFTISPRALHVNYPLDELAADKSLEEKDSFLQNWIQERITHKGVRYYAEATFLLDE
jgi:hypothetical protein